MGTAAAANTFPGRSIQRDEPDNIIRVGLQDKSSVHHDEPDEPDEMTKAEREELMQEATLAAMLAIPKLGIAQEAKGDDNGTNRRITLLMAAFGLITLLGAGANFLTSSGFAVGGKTQEISQTQKDLQRLEAETNKLELRLREYEVWLQTTREKLADKGWKLPPLPKGQD